MTGSVRDYLLERHMDLDLHRPLINENEGVATFLLYNLSGQIIGYHQHRPHASKDRRNDPREGRYFTYLSGKGKASPIGVFGTESLHLTPRIVFVVEGVFDAVRLTKRGVSALAVLSNDPKQDTRNMLRCLGRKVVFVCDNDAAGRRLARGGNVVVLPEGVGDLGEAPEDVVTQIINRFANYIHKENQQP